MSQICVLRVGLSGNWERGYVGWGSFRMGGRGEE